MAPDTDIQNHVDASAAGGKKLPEANIIKSPININAKISRSKLTWLEPKCLLAYSIHIAPIVHEKATPNEMVSPMYGIVCLCWLDMQK